MATRRILIVDDDVDALKLIGMMLETKGYQIVAAANGAQAIEKAVHTKPHLIILDIMMPGMDGFEVITRLRQTPSTQNIPIIVFSGKSQAQDRIAAINMGADLYLTKPAHPEELATHVDRLIKQPALSESRTTALATKPGKVLLFLPVKGGIGNSTLVLNTAVEIKHMKPELRVALVELQDGGGSIAMQAGVQIRKDIGSIVTAPPGSESIPKLINDALTQHKSGVDMLLNKMRPRGADFSLDAETATLILTQMQAQYDLILVDAVPSLSALYASVSQIASNIFLTMEANKLGLELARGFLYKLETLNIKANSLNMIIIHLMPTLGNVSKAMVEQTFNHDVISVIPPSADLAHESLQSGRPMVEIQNNGVLTQQIRRLVQSILEIE